MKLFRNILFILFLNLVTLNILGQSVNDYKSNTSGSWGTRGNWLRWDGSAWLTPTAPQGAPTSASGVITILNTHTMTVAANVAVDQVVIDNGGTVIVNSGKTLTVANGTGNDIINNGTITNGGTIEVNGQVVNNGIYNENYWTYTYNAAASITNNSGKTFTVSSAGQLSVAVSGSSFTNDGTYANNGVTLIQNSGTFNNNSTFNEGYCTLVGYTTDGTFNNNTGANFNVLYLTPTTGGQLYIGYNGATGTFNNNGTLTNNRTVQNPAGLVNNRGNLNNTGTIINNSGTRFINGYYGWVYDDGTFNNYGNYAEKGSTLIGNTTAGIFNNYGSDSLYDLAAVPPYGPQLYIGNSDLSITGTFNNYGTLTNNMVHYAVTYADFSDMVVAYGTLNNSGTITNNGGYWETDVSIVFYKYGLICSGANASLVNTGTITNTGAVDFSNSAVFNNNSTGTYNNTAFTSVDGGFINNYGMYDEDFETFNSIDGTINNKSGGNIDINAASVICFSDAGAELTNDNGGTITNSGIGSLPGLTINVAGTSLTNNGLIIDQGNIRNNGTFTNNDTFDYYMTTGSITGSNYFTYGSSGTLIYHGSIAQTTSNYEFPTGGVPNVTVNNSNGSGVILHASRTVNTLLTLVNGPLKLNSFTLTINNGSNTAVSRSSGYLVSETYDNGSSQTAATPLNTCTSRLQWNNLGNSKGTVYTIPFGTTGGVYIPLIADVTASGVGVGGNLTVATYRTNNSNFPYPGYPDNISNINGSTGSDNSANAVDRFYLVTFNGYTSNPTADLTFTYDAASDLNGISETNLYAQYWSSSGSKWVLPGAGTADPTNDQVNTVTGINASRTWILSNKNNPLPVELIYFSANCNGSKVDLKWSTASETNNDYFTAERSSNTAEWDPLLNVSGAGNSNTLLYYTAEDNEPLDGVSYYRLKQTDFDGAFSYSDAVQVGCDNEEAFNLISVMPGLQDNELVLIFTAKEDEQYNVTLFDARGQLIKNLSGKSVSGINEIHIVASDISNGIYMLTLQNSSKYFGQKILLK